MQSLHLDYLDRNGYIDSVSSIDDVGSRRFAEWSMGWWDRHFSWRHDPCSVLCDEEGTHLSYLFSNTDRYREYLSLHNLFTPQAHRRNGFARALLSQQFDISILAHVKRFKLSCVSSSLGFYDMLGLTYWGLTRAGNYYCDLPMPDKGLDGVGRMVDAHSDKELAGKKAGKIYAHVTRDARELSDTKQEEFRHDRIYLGKNYRYDALQAIQ